MQIARGAQEPLFRVLDVLEIGHFAAFAVPEPGFPLSAKPLEPLKAAFAGKVLEHPVGRRRVVFE